MVWRVNEIGILDNGDGMSKDRLWNVCALVMVTHSRGMKEASNLKTDGKFGVSGLPQASISQCKELTFGATGRRRAQLLHISI